MRTYLIYLLTLTFFLTGCRKSKSPIADNSTNYSNTTSLEYRSGDQILISAHRGGKEVPGYPENCLETMKYLYDQGIRMFEVDIRTSSDNVLVLMHDKSLERTTNGFDHVEKTSYADLTQLYLKDYQHKVTAFKIPDLQSVFDWAIKNNVILQLDLKKINYFLLERTMEGYDLKDKVVLISYSKRQTMLLHKHFPDYKLSVSMRNENEFEQAMILGIPTEKMIAFTGTRLSDPKLYKRINDKGIKTILGTLGNLDKKVENKGDATYIDYVRMGIDIIATDRPRAALKAVATTKTN